MERRPSRSKPDAKAAAAARALRLLARREHTRGELAAKLAPLLDDAAELESLLDDLTARGWLSDTRAAEQLVRAKRGRFGSARIRQALVGRGVPHALIAAALSELEPSELERARTVWARKFREPAADAADRARQVRFLQSRGFSLAVAMRIARGGDYDSPDE